MTKSQSNVSQLKDFLAYLATVKGDLSNITAPPFVLAPKSVTEIPASWAERHDLFLQPAREEDPAQRALLVLKNFVCSLKRQVYMAASASPSSSPSSSTDSLSSTDSKAVTGDSDGDGGAKKPLNAFLGELFLAELTSSNGENSTKTRLIAEQVSHHPPVTACHLYNTEHGISSSGYVAQETSFSLSSGVQVKQVGHALIRDERHLESHLMTPLPTMCVKGLLTGSPYPELEGTSYIASSSGHLATIEFEGKKALGMGTRNGVHATLRDIRNERDLFEISGQWSKRMTIRDCVRKATIEEFEVDEIPLSEAQVRPVEEQSPWESRRAWEKVIEGVREGGMKDISEEKNRIEDAQREMREAEKLAGDVEWHRVFFRRAEGDAEFKLLAQIIPDPAERELCMDRTDGVWKFVGEAAAEALISGGDFHSSLEPTGQVLSK